MPVGQFLALLVKVADPRHRLFRDNIWLFGPVIFCTYAGCLSWIHCVVAVDGRGAFGHPKSAWELTREVTGEVARELSYLVHLRQHWSVTDPRTDQRELEKTVTGRVVDFVIDAVGHERYWREDKPGAPLSEEPDTFLK
jgi:hypothetical protein